MISKDSTISGSQKQRSLNIYGVRQMQEQDFKNGMERLYHLSVEREAWSDTGFSIGYRVHALQTAMEFEQQLSKTESLTEDRKNKIEKLKDKIVSEYVNDVCKSQEPLADRLESLTRFVELAPETLKTDPALYEKFSTAIEELSSHKNRPKP